MAVTTRQAPISLETLSRHVDRWDRRLRLQQTVAWSARALLPGLVLAVGLGLISRLQPLLTNAALLVVALVALALGVAGLLALVWLRRRTPVQAARRFDQTFGLQERVSTALELLQGDIAAVATISQAQVADAWSAAQRVDPVTGLPLRVHWREWGAASALAVALAVLVIVPNDVARQAEAAIQRDAVVEQALDATESAIETVATDPNLDEADRQQLLEALEVNLMTLQDESITAEEALATLGNVEDLITRQVDDMRREIREQDTALESAAEAMQPQPDQPGPEARSEGGPQAEEGEGSAEEQLREALEQAERQLEEMSDTEMAQMAQQMQEAAGEIDQAGAESLSEALEDAAEALEQGDQEAAAEALEEAQQATLELEEEQQAESESADSLEEAAEQAQQAQEEAGSQPAGDQPPQEQDQSGSAAAAAGNQPDGESGEEPPEDMESSEAQGESDRAPEQPDETDAERRGEGASQASQAGQSTGSLTEDTEAAQSQVPMTADTGTETGDEGQYEAVFAPRRLEDPQGPTGPDIELNPDMGDSPLREGDFTDNEVGEATVPYDEVFSSYADAANLALDQGYIPLGLRDVVRDYFTSLAPTSADEEGR